MFTDYTILIFDTLLASMSLLLAYRTALLLSLLYTRKDLHRIASKHWWHWFEHFALGALSLVSSVSIAVLTIEGDINKSVQTVESTHDLLLTVSFSCALLVLSLLISHMIKEETPGSDFEYSPQDAIEHKQDN